MLSCFDPQHKQIVLRVISNLKPQSWPWHRVCNNGLAHHHHTDILLRVGQSQRRSNQLTLKNSDIHCNPILIHPSCLQLFYPYREVYSKRTFEIRTRLKLDKGTKAWKVWFTGEHLDTDASTLISKFSSASGSTSPVASGSCSSCSQQEEPA